MELPYFSIDVPLAHEEPKLHRVIPAHVDEHAREEMLEGLHPDHATNFGLILGLDNYRHESRPDRLSPTSNGIS